MGACRLQHVILQDTVMHCVFVLGSRWSSSSSFGVVQSVPEASSSFFPAAARYVFHWSCSLPELGRYGQSLSGRSCRLTADLSPLEAR